MARLKLTKLNRTVALILALLWLAAGAAAITIGIRKKLWLLIVLGIFAAWYGLIWLRVFRERKQLRWPDGLLPWRTSSRRR
jgi:hypothetical protein